MLFFRHNAVALNRLQYSVNATFICTGKPKVNLTCFTAIFAFLQWSGTTPTVSPRYICTEGEKIRQAAILYPAKLSFPKLNAK